MLLSSARATPATPATSATATTTLFMTDHLLFMTAPLMNVRLKVSRRRSTVRSLAAPLSPANRILRRCRGVDGGSARGQICRLLLHLRLESTEVGGLAFGSRLGSCSGCERRHRDYNQSTDEFVNRAHGMTPNE